ncbi:MAG TPA: NADH-quinone oxidoreductase subunit J [Kofleriaceae bacterium]
MKAAVLAVVLALGAFGGIAAAQPTPANLKQLPTMPMPGRPNVRVVPASEVPGQVRHGAVVTPEELHGDIVQGHDRGMALLFWAFALISVGGAVFVITRRNLIAAVMGMVGSFIGIAATYMLLYANFLAVVQMLVYAGAIMVLFVFVIMILNRPEDEPVAPTGRAGQALGALSIVYLVGRLVMMLVHVQPPVARVLAEAPRHTAEGHAWGSVAAVGTDLFNGGLFPFEAISILLLIAVVGAIAIARPLNADKVVEGIDAGLDPNDPRVEGHSP